MGDKHPARFIRCFVASLDLANLGFATRDYGALGRPSYSPALLLRIWLYGYFNRVRSSRKLEHACRNDLGFIWLCGAQAPDHNTLWRFWEKNREALRAIFNESVQTSRRMGLIGLSTQAVDGTKIQAACHAGKSYDEKDLTGRLERLDEEINALEKEIESSQAGSDEPSAELPQQLANKKALREAMDEARQQLKETKNLKHIHPYEPDARRVKTKGGKPFGYNAQVVADADNQIILASDVSNEANDVHQLTPMLDQARENVKEPGKELEAQSRPEPCPVSLADTGYSSAEQIGKAESKGHRVLAPLHPGTENPKNKPYHASNFEHDADRDVVRCPEGRELPFQRTRNKEGIPVRVYRSAAVCKGCPAFGQCTRDRHGRTIEISEYHEAYQRHRAKMKSEENRTLLKRRSGIVEPVFAQIKSNGGFWRWTYKGLKKVKCQWMMLCTAWNLQKVYRAWVDSDKTHPLRQQDDRKTPPGGTAESCGAYTLSKAHTGSEATVGSRRCRRLTIIDLVKTISIVRPY